MEVCQNGAYDIINVAFINQFPDDTGFPGANFGNQCGDSYYEVNGQTTKLPNSCPFIGKDIKTCQEVYGKKVFLSLGGGLPTDYYLKDEAHATSFADFLWKSFGPNTDATWTTRPFGDAVVDGFDFDIESLISNPGADVPANYQSQYYSTMINHLKYDLFDSSKSYYISGAPQCTFPDVHLNDAFMNSWFDFIFVQLYNTPQCNSRFELGLPADSSDSVFANYFGMDFISSMFSSGMANPSVKIYAGLVRLSYFSILRRL